MDEQAKQDVAAQDVEWKKLQEQLDQLRPRYPEQTFAQFLESMPPDSYVYIVDLELSSSNSNLVASPDITLHCETCKGSRQFGGDGYITSKKTSWESTFLQYLCRNCRTQAVHFAIRYAISTLPTFSATGRGTAIKLGQVPTFGPQLPSRLISLIGPDRELFLQGVRAENRGMGIGAFAYYRRVVENQKNRVIAEIAKVAKTIGSTPEVQELFNKAVNETRFSESLNMVKDVIPQALLIKGQNPLALLHTALSRGLHNPEMTDEHCLALAQSIRTILTELAERASQALKEDKEIQSALSVLMAVPRGEISLE